MKALGKGSIASIVRVGLQIAWVVLWVLLGVLIVAAIGYGLLPALVASGVLSPETFSGAGISWRIVVPAFCIGVVAIAGALIIVWRLKRLFDSFTSGEPFRRENAGHLRVIWITMMVIELAKYALLALTGALLTGDNGVDLKARYSLNIDVSTWGSILILIVLAEVFREGARLKEEQELTI